MLTADYIVGLTDGEGSFTAYIRAPKKEHGAKSYRIECHYYIKLRDDNEKLIRKVHQFFGVGRVSFQKDSRANHHNCYRYEVTNLKEISEVIVPFFDRHSLAGIKINDFNLLKKVVRAVLRKQHHTKAGLKKIIQWKHQMHTYVDSPNTGNPYVRSRYRKSRVPTTSELETGNKLNYPNPSRQGSREDPKLDANRIKVSSVTGTKS